MLTRACSLVSLFGLTCAAWACASPGHAVAGGAATPQQQNASPLPPLSGAEAPVLVAGPISFVSLEGPLWVGDALLFSDVDASKVYRLEPGAPPETRFSLFPFPRQTNGIARDPQGRLLFCERAAGQVTRVEADGALTVLASGFEGKRFNAANDLAVRNDGNIYFTDPQWGRSHEPELDFEGAFRIAPDGQVSLVTRNMRRPNGVALSPAGDVLYVGDDTANEIRRFDVAQDGSVSGEATWVTKASVPGGHFATPDGICVDVSGNLYVANNHESVQAIIVFSPAGDVLGEIAFPGKPSNCSFGGPEGKTLYATVATSIYAVRVATAGLP